MSNRRLVPLNVYASASEPAGSRAGDMYFNTTTSKTYVYDGSAWIVAGGAGGGVTASETVPENPEVGSGWFNTATGNLYIYYDSYWVEVGANGGMPGPQGEPGVVTATSPLTYDAGTQTVGIDQTGITVAQSQVTNLTTDLAAKASTSDLSTHAADTTSVHGIADTSLLATESYADTAASTAASARVSKTGDTITGDLDVSGALTGSVVSGKDPEEILREAVWWIDAAHAGPGQTAPNLGWGGSALDAQVGSTSGSDSNDPKYLDWPGDNGGNYVYATGGTNDFLSVPDEAALDITGDIDIRVHVADWSWANNPGLMSRWVSNGNLSFSLRMLNNGVLRGRWTTDGTTGTQAGTDATAAISYTDGEAIWIRMTLDVDNGSGGFDQKYWTSEDGENWTQVGSTITGGSTTSIYAGTEDLDIGNISNAYELTAKVYRAQLLDGIDGTPVLDVDCSQISSGATTTFTALTGQTVTINRSTSGRKSVAVVSPVWLFGTDDYMRVANHPLLNFGASDDLTIITFSRQWATSPFGVIAGKESYYGPGYPGYAIYDYTEAAGQPRYFMEVQDAIDNTNDIRNSVAYGTVKSLAMVRDAGTSVAYYLDGSLQLSETDLTGDLTNTIDFFVGSRNGTNNNNDMEFTAAAIWRRVLSAEELAALSNYFQTRSGYAIPRNDRATLIKSTNGTRYQLTVDDDGSLVTTEL